VALCVQAFADTNPILNGFTLERDPGSSRPAEVHVSTAATTGTFTGADAGEGLDFSGSFMFAVDVAGTGGQTIGDAVFSDDSSNSALTITAENIIPAWGDAIDFGDSADDDALESVLQSIRWSASPTPVVVTMNGLAFGTEYKLQLLFHEQVRPQRVASAEERRSEAV